MTLQWLARKTSGFFGREAPLIKALRPAYNAALYLRSSGKGVELTFNGHERFRVDPWTRYHFPPDKDPEVCAYLRGHLRQGAVCLNVGAHVGLYALLLSHWSGPSGHVYAFEPNPFANRVLAKHVALNGFQDRIEVIAAAVASASGECVFCAEGLEVHSRLARPNPGAVDHTFSKITVPVTTIDDFCRTRGIRPDCITLDIEGSEVEALFGAGECIREQRGRLELIVELHPHLWNVAGTSPQRLQQALDEFGLRARPLSGQRDPLAEYGIVRLEYA